MASSEYSHGKEQTPRWRVKDRLGQKNGSHATVYLVNGDKYIGEWKDNLKHGKGTYLRAKDGSIYEGEWALDQRSGYGTLAIEGDKKEMRKIYAGGWAHNEFHGVGTFYYDDGTFYEGEWRNHKQNGWGTRHYPDGSRYDGEWQNGKRHGQGVLLLPNHDKYEGMWMNDLKEGPGRFYYRSRNQVYQGEWALDIPKCGTLMALPSIQHRSQHAVGASALPYLELDEPEHVLQHERETLMAQRFERIANEQRA